MNSFNSRSTVRVGKLDYEIFRLDSLDKQGGWPTFALFVKVGTIMSAVTAFLSTHE